MNKQEQAKIIHMAAEELYELIKSLNATLDAGDDLYGFETCYQLMVVAKEINDKNPTLGELQRQIGLT